MYIKRCGNCGSTNKTLGAKYCHKCGANLYNWVGRLNLIISNDPQTKIPLNSRKSWIIGRSSQCDITLDDTRISGTHLRIFIKEGRWYAEDLGSTNGTYINNQRVSNIAEIALRDSIRIGSTSLEITETPQQSFQEDESATAGSIGSGILKREPGVSAVKGLTKKEYSQELKAEDVTGDIPCVTKPRKISKISILRATAIIAALLFISGAGYFLYLAYPRLWSFFSFYPGDSAKDDNSVYIQSRELDISPADGLRITARAGALDVDRVFKAERLDEKGLGSYSEEYGEYGIVPLLGYKLDSGMTPFEIFPGHAELIMDLSRSGIPKGIFHGLTMLKIDEEGVPRELNTTLEKDRLIGRIRSNCVYLAVPSIGMAATTGAVTLTFGAAATAVLERVYRKYGYYQDLKVNCHQIAVEYAKASGSSSPMMIRFNLYWPERLGYGNRCELERVFGEIDNIANKIIESLYPGKYWYQLLPHEQSKVLSSREENAEYRHLTKLLSDPEWLAENYLPREVSLVCSSLQKAAKYLYNPDIRGFHVPEYTLDILIFDEPVGDLGDAYALQKDLLTTYPFIMVNASDQKMAGEADTDKIGKCMDMAIVHELFHATQKEYFTYLSGDKIWFLEACAILLEKEALNYYTKHGWVCSGGDDDRFLDIDDRWETLGLRMVFDPEHADDEKSMDKAIWHGYLLSRYLEFLRDSRIYNKYPDRDFLKNVMEKYSGYFSDSLTAIQGASGIDEAEFRNAFMEFCMANLSEMDRIISAIKEKKREVLFPDLLVHSDAVLSSRLAPLSWNYNIAAQQPMSCSLQYLELADLKDSRYHKETFICLLNLGEDNIIKPAVHDPEGLNYIINYRGSSEWLRIKAGRFQCLEIKPGTTKAVLARIDTNLYADKKNSCGIVALPLSEPEFPEVKISQSILTVKLNAVSQVLNHVSEHYKGLSKPGYIVIIESPGFKSPRVYELLKNEVSLKLIRDKSGNAVDVELQSIDRETTREASGGKKDAVMDAVRRKPVDTKDISVRYAEYISSGKDFILGPLSRNSGASASSTKKWVLSGDPFINDLTNRESSMDVKIGLYKIDAWYTVTHINMYNDVIGTTSASFVFTKAPEQILPGETVNFYIKGEYAGRNNCYEVSLVIRTPDFPFAENISSWYIQSRLDDRCKEPITVNRDLIVAKHDDDTIKRLFNNKARLIYELKGPKGSIEIIYTYEYR